ncbi:MAG: AAA family ATPase, partial [Pyrinomonadaceae bacterium]|nr:AAA family ATPase [Pyrinomonadaceae bacterium]
SQPVSERIAAYGSAEQIQENRTEIIRSFSAATGVTLSPLAAAFIEPYLRAFPQEHAAWFARRQQAGKITEGHGDLRCEHIHFQDDTLTIYDCIEFSERLRCLDWLNDLAFLLMDLEHRRCVPYAAHLQDKMLTALETEPVRALLDFYKTYRACVRGKVHTLKAAETEVPPETQAESRQKARQYFQLALRYTVLGSAPTLIVCLGGVATGKTTVAQALADELGIRQLSSDVVRKQRADVDVLERLPDAERQRLYTPQMTDLVYAELARQGIAETRQSGAAVLDATYRQPEKLQHLQERCHRENIRLVVIETTAPPQEIRKRLAGRETEPMASDMRLADYNPARFSLAYAVEDYATDVLQVNTLQLTTELLKNGIFPWLIRQKEM